LLEEYAARTPASAKLYARAAELFPSGVTHVARYLRPHPIYVTRAHGSRKWDADGHEYVDYFGGHGALLLGHGHPAVVEAVAAQLSRGVHFGAAHELEVEWAEMVRELVPCAGRVRFTNSGTEATLLALRIARAATGKRGVVRFAGHFHGWQDHLAQATPAPAPPAGILPEVADHVLICPPHDAAAVQALLESRADLAAVILEPTGATFGQIPCPPAFLEELRRLTSRHGVLLIFDEVVTGFRCAPGGAQAAYGVTPDLCTLGKIVAGGLPGAAVAGRADLFEQLAFQAEGPRIQPPAIAHQGTCNANPLSAAAGIATLRVLRDGRVHARANSSAAALRHALNETLRECGAPWCVYGDFSGFHLYPNPAGEPVTPAEIQEGKVHWAKLKGATPAGLLHKIRAGFLIHGVDLAPWPGGLLSSAHGEEDLEGTVAALRRVVARLREEGDLG
jgi:glutamate-1-semialdehyde 2,1-aminomutase